MMCNIYKLLICTDISLVLFIEFPLTVDRLESCRLVGNYTNLNFLCYSQISATSLSSLTIHPGVHLAVVGKGWQTDDTAVTKQADACPASEATIESAYQKYDGALRRYVTRILGSEEEATDLVQDVYVRAIRAVQKNKVISFPQAFLFKIASNLLKDKFSLKRNRKSSQHFPIDDIELPVDMVSPEENVEWQKMAGLLKQVLLEMDPKCRRALVLHRFDNLTHEEVAEVMGVSVSSVRRYIEKALMECRAKLPELP